MANAIAYRKAASALQHPLSLTAIFLLLINDHILRRFWPSWITGKLGDFVWLFFFPFVLTLLLACILPVWKGKLKDFPALAGFSLVGGVFTLAKTIPICHHLLVRAMEAVLHIPIGLRLDPTDLIALPSLLAAWWLWRHAPELPAQRLRTIMVVLPLCALLTIANSFDSRPVLIGLTDLATYNNRLIACKRFAEEVYTRFYEDGAAYPGLEVCYSSNDGGESWELLGEPIQEEIYNEIFSGAGNIHMGVEDSETWTTMSDPANPDLLIRYMPNNAIEVSHDGGKTWRVEYSARHVSQAVQAYYRQLHPTAISVKVVSGPRGAVIDTDTGNIIFNMGYGGILVRKPDGSYYPIAVGEVVPNMVRTFGFIWPLLIGEFWLSLLFGGLGIMTLARFWHRDFDLNQLFSPLILWSLWGMTVLVFPPALIADPLGFFPGIIILMLYVFILPVAVEALICLGPYGWRAVLRLLVVMVGCALLFDLAFVLWSQDILPNYYLAAGVGVVLGAGLLVWHYLLTRPSQIQLSLDKDIQTALPKEIRSRRVERNGFIIMLIGGLVGWALFPQGGFMFLLSTTPGYLVILVGVIQHCRAVLKVRKAKRELT